MSWLPPLGMLASPCLHHLIWPPCPWSIRGGTDHMLNTIQMSRDISAVRRFNGSMSTSYCWQHKYCHFSLSSTLTGKPVLAIDVHTGLVYGENHVINRFLFTLLPLGESAHVFAYVVQDFRAWFGSFLFFNCPATGWHYPIIVWSQAWHVT